MAARERMKLAEVNRLGPEGFVSLLGAVFERSPWVAERAWHSRPFESIEELHEALAGAVRDAPKERRLALLRAHPDLAGRAATSGDLTEESRGEQAAAGLDSLTPEEYEAFARINAAYRRRFGFPLIFCAREHTKESIMGGARNRLDNPREKELEVALGEISKIARLRLGDLVFEDHDDRRRGEDLG